MCVGVYVTGHDPGDNVVEFAVPVVVAIAIEVMAVTEVVVAIIVVEFAKAISILESKNSNIIEKLF